MPCSCAAPCDDDGLRQRCPVERIDSVGLAAAPAATEGGVCCAAKSDAGCDVEPIASCVCAFDELCCDSGWDDLCALEAGVCNATC